MTTRATGGRAGRSRRTGAHRDGKHPHFAPGAPDRPQAHHLDETERDDSVPDLAGNVPGQQLADPDVQGLLHPRPIFPQHRGE